MAGNNFSVFKEKIDRINREISTLENRIRVLKSEKKVYESMERTGTK